MAKTDGSSYEDRLWQKAERRMAASTKLGEAGRVAEARAGFSEAAKLFVRAGDDVAVAQCMHAVGVLFVAENEAALALSVFASALSVAELAGEEETIAMCYEGIGTAHYRLEDTSAAVEAFDQALVRYRRIGNKEGIAATLASLGDCRLESEAYGAAREVFGEALALYTALEDRARMVDLNVSLALAAVGLEDDPAAIRYLKTAQALDRELGGRDAAEIRSMLRDLGVHPEARRKPRYH